MSFTKRTMLSKIRGVLQKYPETKSWATDEGMHITVFINNNSVSDRLNKSLDKMYWDINEVCMAGRHRMKVDDNKIYIIAGIDVW